MTTVLLVLVCLLAVIVFLQMGALVEMYGQLRQVRTHLDMVDQPDPLDLGMSQGALPSSVGLPAELDTAQRALVLFLSNKCQTCFEIAADLGGALPKQLWLVVVPVSGGDASSFVARFGLHGERMLVDEREQVVGRLGLEITPSAIVIEEGRLATAQTVPTTRQLYHLLPTTHRSMTLVPRALRAEDDLVPADATRHLENQG